jgi:hypothetical protein
VWAICLLGFFGLLRISNILPPAAGGFDSEKHLARKHIRKTSFGYVIYVFWAKNNQFRRRVLQIPLPSLPGKMLCPSAALGNALAVSREADCNGPAFMRRNSKGGLVPVLYGWFSKRLLDLVVECGECRNDYGTHSLKRGGACWALKCGFNSEIIKLLGDWHSNAYQQYLEVPLSDKLVHMTRFAQALCLS